MNFKEWLHLQEHSFAQLGTEFGPVMATDTGWTALKKGMRILKKSIQKIDRYTGMQKFGTVFPKTIIAQINLVKTTFQFIADPKGKFSDLMMWLQENATLPIMTGVPTFAAGVSLGDQVAGTTGAMVGGVIGKAVFYAYFYLGVWADANTNNPKFSSMAKKVKAIMPKTLSKPKV